MTTITFDTLEFVEELKAAGFDDAQAKGMVGALKRVQESQLKDLATKRDIAELKAETIKWMFGVATGQAMFIIAILKLFPSH